MDIVALFGTDERLKLLQRAYFSDGVRVTELAADTGLSKGFVSLQLAVLVKDGIMRRKGMLFFPKDDPAVRIILIRGVMTNEFLRKHKAEGGTFPNINAEQPYDAWTTSMTASTELKRKLPGCKAIVRSTAPSEAVMFGGDT